MSNHLGPRLTRKPLHMFWLLDVSGSMGVDGKIAALNEAMREAVASTRAAAVENPGVQVLVRAITFAHDAGWHTGIPTDIAEFEWTDVVAVERGTTEVGRALSLAVAAIREVSQTGRGLPPALILVSDGKPTDLKVPSYGAALRELAEEPWGRKASRMAVGIGRDADMAALHRFIGHDEIYPLSAANAAELRHYLRWASTAVVDEGTRSILEQAGPAGFGEVTVDGVVAPTELPPFADAPRPSPRPELQVPPSDLGPPPPPPSDDGPVW